MRALIPYSNLNWEMMCRPNRFFFFLSLAFYFPPPHFFFFYLTLPRVDSLRVHKNSPILIRAISWLLAPIHSAIYLCWTFFFLLFFYPFRSLNRALLCLLLLYFYCFCSIFLYTYRKKGEKKTNVVVKRQSMRLCSSCRGSIARVDTYRYKST